MFRGFTVFIVALSLFLSASVGCSEQKEVGSQPPKNPKLKAKAMEGARRLKADQ
jgi:hypothetical protein